MDPFLASAAGFAACGATGLDPEFAEDSRASKETPGFSEFRTIAVQPGGMAQRMYSGRSPIPSKVGMLTPASFWDSEGLLSPSLRSKNNQSSILQIPHVRQTLAWDCGIACIQMVLRSVTLVVQSPTPRIHRWPFFVPRQIYWPSKIYP